MAKKTKEEIALEAEQKKVLDELDDKNYANYKDNPMFARDAVRPSWIKNPNSKYGKKWSRGHELLNPDLEGDSGSGSGATSNSSSVTTTTNTTNVGKGSVANIANDIMGNAIDSYNDRVASNKANVLSKNEQAAQKRQFDTSKGHTGDRYIDFGTIRKEKQLAERDLREAEAGNPQLQLYKKELERYEQIADKLKSGSRKGNWKIDPEEEKQRLQNVNDRITFLRAGHDFLTRPVMADAQFSGIGARKNWDDINNQLAELEGQRAVLMKKIERGESYKDLTKQLGGFTRDLMKITGDEIDEFGKWAETDGSDTNRYQHEIARNIYDKINQVLEDGNVTPDEVKAIGGLNSEISKLIKEEREKDPAIMNAEDRAKSASAKQGYFLFDQIKAMAVLLVGLSVGSPQMVYSALDQFNKKIADAEADYTVNEIKAFSNNNVKDITGQADAQYTMEQLLPELEKNKAFKNMSKADKAMAVEQLELAFEEYQKYVGSGGKEDFAVWFATQQDNGSGWAAIIKQLISAGALNLDLLKNFGGSPAPQPAKPKGKNVGFNLNTSGNTQRLAQNILNSVNKEAEKGQQTKKLRDVQATVNNAVASRMGGQGASPQGTANAAPVNTSWGRA